MSLADLMGLLLAFIARLITGAQGHWKGCPPTAEQRIYFANHQSHLDWVLIWAATPFKHWLTREVFNAVFVSRQRTDDQDPLEPLVEALTQGDSLVIFPEGTRSNQGEPMPFKSGLYHLAQQFPQVQLIPAWIDNVQRVMPKGEVVPVPILCTVTFGAPMSLGDGEDKQAFLERARDAVIALRPRVA
jgi:1-acyl-sn-glycerol-3-phosphate acyltransferase